ncbi:hypothetical protein [Cellulomonas cellasea]|nr:hypothetical protein [Cellulomonas cellasea]
MQNARSTEPVELASTGWKVTASEYADAYLSVLHEQVPATTWKSTPPGRMLEGIVIADAIITAPTPHELDSRCSQHGLLTPDFRSGTGAPHTWLRNPLLQSMRLQSLAPRLSLASRLTYRTASRRPCVPRRIWGAGQWPAHGWVPPTMWPDCAAQLGLGNREHAAAALSLALSKTGSDVPLRVIALDLGLPTWLADRIGAVLRRPGVDRLTAELDTLFTTLQEAPPPINYSDRVTYGRDKALIMSATETALTDSATTRPEPSCREGAAVALWTVFTGSHSSYCPWATSEITATLPPSVDASVFFTRAFDRLPHRSDEPMTWTPP